MAASRCYTESDDASLYQVSIDPPDGADSNDLVDELRATIDPGRDPWSSLAQVAQATVQDRGRQLDDRLRSDASTLNELNEKVAGARSGIVGVRGPPGP